MTEFSSAQPSYFGRTEIAAFASMSAEGSADAAARDFAIRALAGRDRAKDLSAALSWNSGEPLFHAWPQKISGALAAAYPVFLHLLGGGAHALNEVLNHPAFVVRQRTHTRNLALIALQLVAKPGDEAQAKALSEYASFLKYAALQQIEPDEFPERMSNVRLKSCKELVRAKAREGRARSKIAARADAPPATTPDNQPETEATAERCEPPAPNSPPTPAEPVAMPAAPPMAKTVPTDSRVQSLPEPRMSIAIVGKGGRSKTFTCELNAEIERVLLSIPWEKSNHRDVFHLLSTLAKIVNETRGQIRKGSEVGQSKFVAGEVAATEASVNDLGRRLLQPARKTVATTPKG